MQFQVDVFQFEFCHRVAKPSVAVFVCQIVVVVLDGSRQGELFGHEDIDFHPFSGRTDCSHKVVLFPVGLALVPTESAAEHEIQPRQGGDGSTCPETDGARVVGVEDAADELLALGILIAAESPQSGLQPIKALAAVGAEAIIVGQCLLADGLYDTRCAVIVVAVNLIVSSVSVVGIHVVIRRRTAWL